MRNTYLPTIYICSLLLLPVAANAQALRDPWAFQAQNRASIAALMQQVERGNNNGSTVSGGSNVSVTTLTCGSDGKSSASGNSTCVILSNAAGSVDVGQDSKGSQTATSSTTQTENHLQNADSVLATLQGKTAN